MGALRERETTCASLKPAWKTLRFHHVGMAFFWACSMLTFRSSILLSGILDSPLPASIVTLISFTANMTTLFAFASVAERNPLFFKRIPLSAVAAATILGLALLFVAGETPGPAPFVIMVAGSALTGACYGFMWGGWAECYGRMNPCHTAIYLPLCFVVTAALFSVIGLAAQCTPIPSLALMVPLPCISLWCLARCRRQYPGPATVRKTGQNRSLKALESLLGLIVASLILSCLFGFIWEMAVLSVKSVTNAHQLPLVFNLVVALALLGFVSIAQRRTNLALAYQVLVPLLVMFFAIMPFVWHDNPILLNSIMSACYGVFDVIIWYMVAATAYDFAVSGFVVGGLVRALSILARLIGIGIGYLVMLVPEVASGAIVGVCIAAVYLLVMLLWFLWHSAKHPSFEVPEDDDDAEPAPSLTGPAIVYGCMNLGSKPTANENGTDGTFSAEGAEIASANAEAAMANATADAAGAEKEPPVDDTPDEAVFALIAEDYGLTRREAEVLPYLARGRSAKVIAEALFVSESTIRTHTRRIFEKTCIHSKQELIDLVDKY